MTKLKWWGKVGRGLGRERRGWKEGTHPRSSGLTKARRSLATFKMTDSIKLLRDVLIIAQTREGFLGFTGFPAITL